MCDVTCILTCNRWGCRKCGPRKAKRLAYRIEKAEPNKLITLTIDPKLYTEPREAYDQTRRQLPELSKKIKSAIGSFEYLRVLETTRAGWPHYHLMARCPYIPQKTLSELWAGLTSAPIVDVRQIKRIDNVFAYVVKYLCKQTYIPWTNRRTSWSKGFFKPEDKFEPQPLRLNQFEIHQQHPDLTLDEKFPGWVLEQISATAFFIRPPDDEEPLQYRERGATANDADSPQTRRTSPHAEDSPDF